MPLGDGDHLRPVEHDGPKVWIPGQRSDRHVPQPTAHVDQRAGRREGAAVDEGSRGVPSRSHGLREFLRLSRTAGLPRLPAQQRLALIPAGAEGLGQSAEERPPAAADQLGEAAHRSRRVEREGAGERRGPEGAIRLLREDAEARAGPEGASEGGRLGLDAMTLGELACGRGPVALEEIGNDQPGDGGDGLAGPGRHQHLHQHRLRRALSGQRARSRPACG